MANNTRTGTANPGTVTVLDGGTSRRILQLQQDPNVSLADKVRGPFGLTFSSDHLAFDTSASGLEPLIYGDERRSFFVVPERHETLLGYNRVLVDRSYRFRAFHHPYTALFLRELARSGLQGLLNRQIQTSPASYYPANSFDFAAVYRPVPPDVVENIAAKDIVDFDRSGAYAIYNWEIFFHAPFLVACRLMENKRFEEALRWFHYVFDPTSIDGAETPQRFWVTKPFFDTRRTTARAGSRTRSRPSAPTSTSCAPGATPRSTRTGSPGSARWATRRMS